MIRLSVFLFEDFTSYIMRGNENNSGYKLEGAIYNYV